MKKKIIIIALCVCILVSGGITAYMYWNTTKANEQNRGLFVDRGDSDGYATVYYLCTTL